MLKEQTNLGEEHNTDDQQSKQKSDLAIKEVILVLHGIRDHGEWQESVNKVLSQIPQTVVIPLKYEFFDTLRFWFPILTRRAPIKRVLKALRDVQGQDNFRGARISVIAHSFGTYIITKILDENPDISLHRLVLCGAVVSRRFNWTRYRRQVDNGNIINDCGIKDIWPVLAQSVSFGYGASGIYGFGCPSVKDRWHEFGHTGFLNDNFIIKYW